MNFKQEPTCKLSTYLGEDIHVLDKVSSKLSNLGFVMVHGLNDGHISTYRDIEFPLGKFQTFIVIKSSDKQQLIFE